MSFCIFYENKPTIYSKFRKRSLKEGRYIAILIDGKYLKKDQVIIVMGIAEKGEKRILDFIQSTTENERAVRQLLVHINHRGLHYTEGLLVIIDGSKGLRAAVKEVYGHKAVIQRCTWHKRENVVSYLKEDLKVEFRSKLNACYNEPNYYKAKQGLLEIKSELEIINPSAARSLEDGLEETLTLQKLQVHPLFKRSLSTTNCIENVNNLLNKRISKIKTWVNGKQIESWTILSLLNVEKRLNKIHNYKKISLLRDKLKEITKTKKTYKLLLAENGQGLGFSASKISTKYRA